MLCTSQVILSGSWSRHLAFSYPVHTPVEVGMGFLVHILCGLILAIGVLVFFAIVTHVSPLTVV